MKLIPFSFGRIVHVGLFLLFTQNALSQDILWEKSLGGRQADILTDAQPTPDYGFIMAGSSLSKKSGNKTDDNKGNLDYWIWKMDEDGEMEWQKSFGGEDADFLQSIILTRDGGFMLAGSSSSNKSFDKTENSKGQEDFWIIKLNAGGGIQWQKTIGGIGQDKLQSIIQTKEGGYLIGGTSDSNKSGDKTTKDYGATDFWVVKTDEKGEIEWQKSFGGSFIDELRSVEQTKDGSYMIGGYSNSPANGNKTDDCHGIGDYWIIKLDKKGDIEWQKTIGGRGDDQLTLVHQTHDGNFLIAGTSNSPSSFEKKINNTSGTDFWLIKITPDGNNIWQETYSIGREDILTSVIENDDHSLLIGGFAQSEVDSGEKDDKGINDFVGIKINENGQETWRKSVGSYGEDTLKKLIETRDGGYVLAGTSNPSQKGNQGFGKTTKKQTESSIKLGNGKNVKALDDATALANEQVKELNETVNKFYNDVSSQVNKKIEQLTDKTNKDSRVKFGMNTSMSDGLFSNNNLFGNGASGDLLSGLTGAGDNKSPNSSASRDKEKNYGGQDFWVVKLKDKTKVTKEKLPIEAFPNPTVAYTNVVIGFDFGHGYGTLVNMGGVTLKQFEVTSKTVPVDLSPYPMGIYIIYIKTDNGSESIKIIKTQN